MPLSHFNFKKLEESINEHRKNVSDEDVLTSVLSKLLEIHGKRVDGNIQPAEWHQFLMFWPPRFVKAVNENRFACFFGAGLSLSAGAPDWGVLLRQHLKLSKEFIEDDDLKNDPLTLAEIAAQRMGSHAVQSVLRELMRHLSLPTSSHLLLAILRSPIYITTNYDDLFERAWRFINPTTHLRILVNDGDLRSLTIPWNDRGQNDTLLFKIHGCVSRKDEHLILTRSDYRSHYRTNGAFFDAVSEILESRHVLFTGFSHRDPEVMRLVEDAIHHYVRASSEPGVQRDPLERPNFYSLQFDMHKHTPEIFAARGLVALRPPFVALAPEKVRSASLGVALGELSIAATSLVHSRASLDSDLDRATKAIAAPLAEALKCLEGAQSNALLFLSGKRNDVSKRLLVKLGTLASQGIWLLNADGDVVDCELPTGLDRDGRLNATTEKGGLSERQYFRVAKTFRQPFVADSAKSVFNGFSTVFLCAPILKDEQFHGLLFAATQIGTWQVPLGEAEKSWGLGRSFVMLDSNGVVLLPPNREFDLSESKGFKDGESEAANRGFDYKRLLVVSRRDALASHVVENIIPLTQDDDVFEIASDLTYYSVVAEIPQTRWKLAICEPIFK